VYGPHGRSSRFSRPQQLLHYPHEAECTRLRLLMLIKCGRDGNRNWVLWICMQEHWPFDTGRVRRSVLELLYSDRPTEPAELMRAFMPPVAWNTSKSGAGKMMKLQNAFVIPSIVSVTRECFTHMPPHHFRQHVTDTRCETIRSAVTYECRERCSSNKAVSSHLCGPRLGSRPGHWISSEMFCTLPQTLQTNTLQYKCRLRHNCLVILTHSPEISHPTSRHYIAV
jgi:hypothetical protein